MNFTAPESVSLSTAIREKIHSEVVESVAADAVRGVTARVVFLSLALAAFFGYVLPIIDVRLSNTYLGASHLPPGAVGVLLLLLLVNPFLKLLSSRLAFSRNEVLTVYITCLFSCLVPGHSGENFFVPVLIAPFYFATRDNKWLDFLTPYIKPWMSPAMTGGDYSVANQGVVQSWYTGSPDVPWGAWLVPLFAWSALVLLSYTMLGCLGVMLRAQWAQREALAFPLLRLPLEMTEGTGSQQRDSFFRNRVMWIGFGAAAALGLLNGLNVYFPDIPAVPLRLDMTQYFVEAPWNQIGLTPIVVWPIVVGVAFLLTAEVSFSIWFFYWLVKAQYIVAFSLGYMPSILPLHTGATAAAGAKAFTSFQQIGAFLTYAAFVVWLGREHFVHIARRAFGRAAARPEEKQEALSYPAAFWGFTLSFLCLVGWCVAAGMNLPVALLLWGGYLVIALVLTRVVAEGGLLFVQQGWSPVGAIAQLFGSGPGTMFPASSVVPAQFVQVSMMTDMRAFLLPSFVQSFKLAHDRKIEARPLLALIAVVVLVSFGLGIWMNVRLGYEHSGLSLNKWFANAGAQIPARDAAAMVNGARDGGVVNWIWMVVGGGVTWSMMAARAHLVWFPLHPIGYLMALTGPAHQLWFSMFLGWLAKTLITRFGGNESYRKATPFFLGLALGDVTMMLFWLLVDGWTGRLAHQIAVG